MGGLVCIKNHAWFIGYAPEEDPEILVTVVVVEGEHGSSAAGPIAKAIIEQYITEKNELEGIVPEEIPEVVEKKTAPVVKNIIESEVVEEKVNSSENIPQEIHLEELQEEVPIESELPNPIPAETDETN